MTPLPLMLNRDARGAHPRAIARVERAFAAAGVPIDLQLVTAAEVEPAVTRAAASGMVAVGGGDGTLSGAAEALMGTGAPLLPVPVGSVNGQVFINNVSIGIYPRFVRTRERLRPRIGRRLAIAAAALHSLWRLRQVTIGVEACGTERERSIAGMWIGLGRGSFRLPGDAAPIAARNLEMVIAPGHGRLHLVADAIRAVAALGRWTSPATARPSG